MMQKGIINAIIEQNEEEDTQVHEDTLMNLHKRLGHLNYDAVVRLAKDPSSGIKITDDRRENCLTCAQGKQTKNKQNQKDTHRQNWRGDLQRLERTNDSNRQKWQQVHDKFHRS